MLQPLLGGHTVWQARSEINPKASFERPGASKGVQSPSENFNRFPRIQNYQWLTGGRRPKNRRPRRAADMGRARRQGGRSYAARLPTRPIAYSACTACPRPSQILAFRRLICFAGGPQPPCECPAQPTRRPLAAWRTYSERSLSGCQEKCSIFDSSKAGVIGDWRIFHRPHLRRPAPKATGPRKPALSLPKEPALSCRRGCSSRRRFRAPWIVPSLRSGRLFEALALQQRLRTRGGLGVTQPGNSVRAARLQPRPATSPVACHI
jgi:hypothetical protein